MKDKILRQLWLFLLLLTIASVNAQDKIYHIDFKQELVYLGAGIGLTTLGIILESNVDVVTLEEINALNVEDIWSFDRSATTNMSNKAKTASDVILYTSASIPILAYLTRKCRREGLSVGLMAIETILLTGGVTKITKGSVKRLRPFNYNPEIDLEVKLTKNARRSYFSGHASTSAALSFFAAKVLTDLHPEMKNKYLVWTTAAAIPAVVGYLRYKAGRHFPTDVITGYLVGASIGYLVPTLHLNKNVSLSSYGTSGFSLRIGLR